VSPRAFPSQDFLLSVDWFFLRLGSQRTQFISTHLRQQISIGHGRWTSGLDTSLTITELSIVQLHNEGQISHDRWHWKKRRLATIKEEGEKWHNWRKLESGNCTALYCMTLQVTDLFTRLGIQRSIKSVKILFQSNLMKAHLLISQKSPVIVTEYFGSCSSL